MSTPKICNIEHKMIYAVCATLMIVVLYFYFLGFTYYISDNMSSEKLGTVIISLSVFSSNLIVTFIPINSISRFKICMLIAGVFSMYIFGIWQYSIENNIFEVMLIVFLSIQFHFPLLTKSIGKISIINNNVLIIFFMFIAAVIILLLSNDPNFEYYDPVLIISSSIISLMLINPKSISNMNISNMSYIIMKSIIIIILTIIFTYVMADLTNYDRVEKSCMFSTIDCVNKTIAIAYIVLSGILLSPILVTYRGIKSKWIHGRVLNGL